MLWVKALRRRWRWFPPISNFSRGSHAPGANPYWPFISPYLSESRLYPKRLVTCRGLLSCKGTSLFVQSFPWWDLKPSAWRRPTVHRPQGFNFLGRKPILWSLDINPGRPPRLPSKESVSTKHHSTSRSVSSYASTLSLRKNSEACPPTSATWPCLSTEGPDDAGRKYVRFC